jgi:D-alanyl-D-alanine carboxypeptidase/D-alanyl-D-alanine-endopeptidase (penicillin-binding protein 4)
VLGAAFALAWAPAQSNTLASDLDRIFSDPILSRAVVGVRIESLADGRVLYQRDSAKLVMPASNMKLHTLAVAAERLGWDFRYETRLEAAGSIDARSGTLRGDLVVVGSGDPSIVSLDFLPAPVFGEWAEALWQAGVRRVTGRLIGDDRAFADEPLGPGWAWDYLDAGYAAPSGALSYNENTVTVRAWPGAQPGSPVRVELSPAGHGLEVVNELATGAAGTSARIELLKPSGQPRLTLRGSLPASGTVVTRVTTIDRPTRFFVGGLRLALEARGIHVAGGACEIADVASPPTADGRRVIATRMSQPLSSLAGYFMKVSQNFYAEMLLKTIGHAAGRTGSTAEGRRVARETLTGWGIPADAFVMNDGSGLSRYDYTTADTVVTMLRHIWHDERLRGPFVAALPVGGHDGTLDTRMRGTILDGRVEAKTGTISNVRALSGYMETKSGERIVFSIIANNFTAPTGQIDAIAERALARVAER